MSDSDRARHEREQREKAEREQREAREKEQREQAQRQQSGQHGQQQSADQQEQEQRREQQRQANQQAQKAMEEAGTAGRDINKNPAGIADVDAEPEEMGEPEGDGSYRGPLVPQRELMAQGGPFRPKPEDQQQTQDQQKNQQGEPMPGRFGRQVTPGQHDQQAENRQADRRDGR